LSSFAASTHFQEPGYRELLFLRSRCLSFCIPAARLLFSPSGQQLLSTASSKNSPTPFGALPRRHFFFLASSDGFVFPFTSAAISVCRATPASFFFFSSFHPAPNDKIGFFFLAIFSLTRPPAQFSSPSTPPCSRFPDPLDLPRSLFFFPLSKSRFFLCQKTGLLLRKRFFFLTGVPFLPPNDFQPKRTHLPAPSPRHRMTLTTKKLGLCVFLLSPLQTLLKGGPRFPSTPFFFL